MRVPLLLDLFCCAGGAGEGYTRAGFHVVGCDVKPQRHNPHEMYVGDALACLDTLVAGKRWNGYRLRDFTAIHASPPCQDYSLGAVINGHRGTGVIAPRLIVPVRDRLRASEKPWVLENVRGALVDMENPVQLCGTSLGLRVRRHRLFDSSHLLFGAGPCLHQARDLSIDRYKARFCDTRNGRTWQDSKGRTRYAPEHARIADARAAMGIDWMTQDELGEAIPPAYTEWLGRQLLLACRAERSA